MSTVSANRRKNNTPQGENILTTLIPGLNRPINIQFPDGKLPVCQRCKKIYKTRDLCRVRGGHTDVPWNTTYLSLSFDDSCLTHNIKRELCLVDEEMMQCRFEATLIDEPPLPFRVKKIHEDDLFSPICTSCKEKNYTRHHCREKQQHSQLPWTTHYIMLSRVDLRPGDYGANQMAPGVRGSSRQSTEYGSPPSSRNQNIYRISEGDKASSKAPEKEFIDDINKALVPESRSCLLTINGSSSTLRWLEIDPCVPRTEYRPIRNFSGTPLHQWDMPAMLKQIPHVPMDVHYNRTGSGNESYHQQIRLNNHSLPGGGVNTIESGGTIDGGNGLITPAMSHFTPVPKSPYSVRGPVTGPSHQFDPQHRREYQYHQNWNQSAGYQYHGPPIQNQAALRPPFYLDYQQNHFNVDPHQQINHNMRQPHTGDHVNQQSHQEGPNNDYYNKLIATPATM